MNTLLLINNTINSERDNIETMPLDIKSAELTVRQRENSLMDAKDNLSDYYIRSPFDGVIAVMNAKKGDSVSANTAIATLITKQRIAEISLNEIDVAKIKTGQKVNLTFDAVPDLNITGEVTEIDTVGTVEQGVVTYNVKTSFDTEDERVKPGMSVSAAIITDSKQDVIMVPNGAVKTRGRIHYVEMFDVEIPKSTGQASQAGFASPTLPREQAVEIGLANDSFTEIISGLKEGDQVVSRTIQPTAAKTTAPSIFGAPARTPAAR